MVEKEASQRARTVERTARVLVVDDHEDCLSTTMEIVAMHGHQAIGARSGVEAIEVAVALQPDLVLMDLVLPDITGHEAARQILADSRCGQPIVVAVTGLGSDSARLLSDRAGMALHLVKPVRVATLLAVVNAAAQRNHGRAS